MYRKDMLAYEDEIYSHDGKQPRSVVQLVLTLPCEGENPETRAIESRKRGEKSHVNIGHISDVDVSLLSEEASNLPITLVRMLQPG